MATVFDSSDPVSMIRRQSGMISVDKRKLMTSLLSFCLTSAPMTPSEVRRRYSNGRVFEVVLRNGYRNKGMWADRKRERVSLCEATHCRRARALQTRFEACAVSEGGARSGYTDTISCSRADMTP